MSTRKERVLELLEDALGTDNEDLKETVDAIFEEVDGIQALIESIAPKTLSKSMDKLSNGIDDVSNRLDSTATVNAVLKKSLDRLSAIERAQERIAGWGDGVKATADRMVSAANALASVEKVRDYTERSVYVVKNRAAAPHAYVGVFPLNATGLKDARELRESQPGLIVCSAIWHGALKIGDAVE